MNKKPRIFLKIFGLELLIIFFFTLNGAYVMMTEPANAVFQYAGLFPLAAGVYFYLSITKKWRDYFSFGKLQPIQQTLLLCSPLFIILIMLFIGNGGIKTSSLSDLLMVLAIQIFVVAFIEEIFFRGFMINILMSKGFKAAVIISSALFAITHSLQLLGGQSIEETILQITYAFLVGMALSLLIVNKQSILITITFHALNNFFVIMGAGNSSTAFNYILNGILAAYTVFLWMKADPSISLSKTKN